MHTIPEKIASDPVFPPWYARAFRGRWRFAVSRLAVEATPINYQVLDAMAAESSLDARVLKRIRALLARTAWLERHVTLAWLAVRLRPYPLSRLLASHLSRWRGVAAA